MINSIYKLITVIFGIKMLRKLKKLFTNKLPTIAVINLYGVISSGKSFNKSTLSLDSIKSNIDKAFELPQLKAVALAINSPGGSPVQTELIYKYIRRLATEKKISIYSFAEDVAASGGYWLACVGDEIYASSSSIIGSIGVISSGFGFVDVIKKIGIERRIYTQGENKSVLDPFKPEKQSDIKIIHGIQHDIHDNFKSVILERRKGHLKANHDLLFNGEFWSGKKAKELGLIDEIGDLYTVINQKFDNRCNIVKVGSEGSWLKKKLGINLSVSDFIDSAAAKVEEKIILNRFGL